MDLKSQLEPVIAGFIADICDKIYNELSTAATKQMQDYVRTQLKEVDFQEGIAQAIQQLARENLNGNLFADNSIPCRAVDFKGLTLSGDAIKGGIITAFGSQGIEDRASHVQMTLLDHAVAFENSLHTPEAIITGNLSVGGSVNFLGSIDTESAAVQQLIQQAGDCARNLLNKDLLGDFTQTVFEQIQTQGLDLNKITMDSRVVIDGNRLGYHIIDSNLQRLGMVRDLQTQGEAYLSETLYTSGKRVGINTLEPNSALDIWDQEVEITVNKHSEHCAFIGTPRFQKLVIGANSKQNIVVSPDGTVQVQHLDIGPVAMSTHNKIPDFASRAAHIVWNTNPTEGQPIGWVCLGDSRWAGFGCVGNT